MNAKNRKTVDPGERFEELAALGRGAMGTVVRAMDHVRGHEVALKRLIHVTPKGLLGFKQEFRSLVQRIHPNIVTLYELFGDASHDEWYLTMELVEGARDFLEYVRPHQHLSLPARGPDGEDDHSDELDGDTHSVLPSSSPKQGPHVGWSEKARRLELAVVDPVRLRKALEQLIGGLDYVHALGLVHRDLKPSNVLVDQHGRVVICDFGLTVARGAAREVAGTLAYMAPEQIDDAGLPASDIYAVGVMLYQALTGRLPVSPEGTVVEIFEAKRKGDVLAPREVVPEADQTLSELAVRMLATDPGKRPTATELRRQLGSKSSIPSPRESSRDVFVGRNHEQRVLADAFRRVREGGPTETIFVGGPSGVGKSSLVERFLSSLERGNFLLLRGRCYQSETVPFKALDALVDEMALALEREDLPIEKAHRRSLRALAQLFPVLRRVPGIWSPVSEQGVLPPQLVREEAAVGLRLVLRMLAKHRPVVMVFDDLQWGDLDSEPLLRGLIEDQESQGVLILATHRVDSSVDENKRNLVQALLRRGAGNQLIQRLSLEPLSSSEAGDLVSAIRGVSQEDRDRIVTEAAGSPLFIVELLRSWELGKKASDLDQLLQLRVKRLEPAPRRLLESVCLAGVPQSVRILARTLSVPDASQAATALLAQRLIRLGEDARGQVIAPYHDRIREAVIAGMPQEERKQLHRKLAEAFEREQPLDLDALAVHWHGAGAPRRALKFAVAAGDKAWSAHAPLRAAQHFSRALASPLLSDAERNALGERHAECLMGAGTTRDAARAYLSLVEQVEDPLRKSHFRTQAFVALARTGATDEAMALADKLGQAFSFPIPRSSTSAMALAARSRLKMFWRRPERYLATENRELAPATRERLDALHEISSAMHLDPLIGYALHSLSFSEALRSGGPREQARVLALEIGFIAGEKGADGTAAMVRSLNLSLRAAATARSPSYGAWARAMFAMAEGTVIYRQMRANGERILTEVEHMRRDPELAWEADAMLAWAMDAFAWGGGYSTLREHLPSALRRAREMQNQALEDRLRLTVAPQLSLASGEPDEIVSALGAEVDSENPNLHHWYRAHFLAEVAAYQGRAAEGLSLLCRFREKMRKSPLAWVQVIHLLVDSQIGVLAAGLLISRGQNREYLSIARRSLKTLRTKQKFCPEFAGGRRALLEALLLRAAGRTAGLKLQEASSLLHACQDAVALAIDHELANHFDDEDARRQQHAARERLVNEGVAELERWVQVKCPITNGLD